MGGYWQSNKGELITAKIIWCAWLLPLVGIVLPLTTAVMAQGQVNPIIVAKDVSMDDLPSTVDRRIVPGTSKQGLRQILVKQPSLVLDGATLFVTAPQVGFSRTIAVNNLEFRHGGRIVTNGVDLEIDALLIVSDKGEVLSFDEPTRHNGENAAVGTNGKPGLNAGTVVLNGSLREGDSVAVFLTGQDGQKGGTGVTGPGGVSGPRGSDAADHLIDCGSGGGDGGTGSPGGRGGDGGAGGAGGNGGRLILRGDLPRQRTQIEFGAPGGSGGIGGEHGSGGPGGPGGQGGSGSRYCSGGRTGKGGPEGPPGNNGTNGTDGQPGSISAD